MNWTPEQIEKAHGIVNDISEEIDNRETRAVLREALAIYADLLEDYHQKRNLSAGERIITSLLAAGLSDPWLPIKTAPKDGTIIDVWVPEPKNKQFSAHRVPCCKWHDGKKTWVLEHFSIPIKTLAAEPTHWMPLPKPPVTNTP